MTIQNMKIGTRLIFSFVVLVAILIAISLNSIVQMNNLSSLTNKLYDHPYTVSTAALRVKGTITAMHRSMQDVALAKDAAAIENAAEIVNSYESQAIEDFDLILERVLGDKSDIEAAKRNFINWKEIRDEVITLKENGQNDEAAAITKGKGADHINLIYGQIDGIIDFAESLYMYILSIAEAFLWTKISPVTCITESQFCLPVLYM